MLFKFLKAENTMICNPLLYVKMTSNSLFWWQKWQNIEICMLIRSIIPNINSFENFTMFLHLWKNWDKISQVVFSYERTIIAHEQWKQLSQWSKHRWIFNTMHSGEPTCCQKSFHVTEVSFTPISTNSAC